MKLRPLQREDISPEWCVKENRMYLLAYYPVIYKKVKDFTGVVYTRPFVFAPMPIGDFFINVTTGTIYSGNRPVHSRQLEIIGDHHARKQARKKITAGREGPATDTHTG